MRLLPLFITTLVVSGCTLLNPLTIVVERSLPQPEHASDFVHETALMRSFDGIALHTEIFKPTAASRETPCMLVRIPLPEGMQYDLYRATFGALWARRGYTTIIQNVRGFPPSDGSFAPFRFERADGIELLNWLQTRGLCGDSITSWGGSYFGLTQWAIGDQIKGPKMIQIASPRLAQVFFRGGVFALETALYWSARNHGRTPTPDEVREAAAAAAVTDTDDHLLGANDPAFDEWLTTGVSEEGWRKHFPSAVDAMTGPVFLMGGWYDPFLPAMLADMHELKARGEEVTLTIGPWAHAFTVQLADGHRERNYRIESLARPIELLRCRRQPGCIPPPIELFIMGSNRWLQSTSYPPPETTPQVWLVDLAHRVLHVGNKTTANGSSDPRQHQLTLNPHDPTPSMGGIALGDDVGPLSQSELVRRPEVISLTSYPLEHDVTIIGEPTLTGTVVHSGCTPDLTVTLIDTSPDGNRYLVTEGISRVPSPPGTHATQVPLSPTAYTFKRGHRVELVLAPAKFPKYALPPCATSLGVTSATLVLDDTPGSPWKLTLGVLR